MTKLINIQRSISDVTKKSNISSVNPSGVVSSSDDLQKVTDRGSVTNNVIQAKGIRLSDILIIPKDAPSESLLEEGEVSLYFTSLAGAGSEDPPEVDLSNYYIKSAVDALVALAYNNSKSYTDAAVAGVASFNISVVSALPATGAERTIYLVPKAAATNDAYDEYLYINSDWEHIGTTDVNLSDYYNQTAVDNLLSQKQDVINNSQEGGVYLNGIKGWSNFASSVRTSVLTGLSLLSSLTVTAADTVLSAIGKLQTQIISLRTFSSLRNFSSGTLIKTSIDATTLTPFLMKLNGNSSGTYIPFSIVLQGCFTTSATIVNCSAISNGQFVSEIRAFMYDGVLCFWFARQAADQSFSVECYNVLSTATGNNLVTAINDQAKPAGSAEVNIVPVQTYNSRNANNADIDWTAKKVTAAKLSAAILELPSSAPATADMESGKIYMYYNNI